MLLPLLRMCAAATALSVAAGITSMVPHPQQTASPALQEAYPAPTNLKVLPKDMTGAQVNQVMEQWKQQLSMDCNACHKEEFKNVDAAGRPVLNFADDSKPEKRTARVMYTMTEEINVRYISTIDSSGVPVTCGTCHRGHVGPEPMLFPLRGSKDPAQTSPYPAESTKPQ